MNIVELLQQDNFKTKHVAMTNGSENHGENKILTKKHNGVFWSCDDHKL